MNDFLFSFFLFFLLIFLYFIVIYKTYWWVGILPIITVFTRYKFIGIKVSPEKLYILLSSPAILIIIFNNLVSKKVKFHPPKVLKMTFFIFWFSLSFTQLFHVKALPSGSTLTFLFNYFAQGLLVWLIVIFIDKKYKFEFCLKTLICALLIIVILGFIEILISGNFFLFRFKKSILYIPLSSFTPLFNPNLLARHIVILFPFIAFGVYYFRKEVVLFSISLTAALGSAVLIFSTLSRAGIASFLMQSLAYLFFLRRVIFKKYIFLIAGILIVIIGINLIGAELFNRLQDMNEVLLSAFNAQDRSKMRRRMRIWLGVAEIIKENPIMGVGLEGMDDFLLNYGCIRNDNHKLKLVRPHGNLLYFLVIGGVIVVLPFLALLYSYFNFLIEKTKAMKDKVPKFFIRSALLSFAGVLICSIPANPFGLNILWFTVGFTISGVNVFDAFAASKPALKGEV